MGHVVSRIGELRKRAGLSVSELARRSGVGRTHLSGLLNGSKTNMQLSIFDVLITTLGAEEEMRLVERYHNSQIMQLALAAGAETVASGEGPPRPHLHAVPNTGASPPRAAEPARATAAGQAANSPGAAEPARETPPKPSAAPSDAAPRSQTSNNAERRATAQEKARAEQEKARADEAEARAAQERARAEQEKARAEQETARAAEAAEHAARAAARAELTDRLLIAGGVTMMVVGGVMVYKGLTSPPAYL